MPRAFDALPVAQPSDISVAGDPLALPHLLPQPAAHPDTVAGFAALARTLAADRGRWEPLVRYDATTRWYARLRTEPGIPEGAGSLSHPGYEVWLLSWLPGQGTGAHDHGPSGAVLTVLQGTLTEHASSAGPLGRALAAGAQRFLAPGCVHQVVNDTLEPAVSLHVYFPGLTEMNGHPAVPRAERTDVVTP